MELLLSLREEMHFENYFTRQLVGIEVGAPKKKTKNMTTAIAATALCPSFHQAKRMLLE